MKLTPDQERVVRAEGGVAVVAGAGSGKTRTLVFRYLELLDRGLRPLQLVAVTFTEAAAAELRARLREHLAGHRHDLLPELEAAPIGTFHALAARICREHPRAAGVPADFRVQDEVESALWLREHLPLAVAGLPREVFEVIPFNLLKESLAALLQDPLAAEEAFDRGPEEMRTLLENRLAELYNEAKVQVERLGALQGPDGDSMEDQRLRILAAADEGREALWAAAREISLRGGSRKRWGEDRLDEVKITLETVRKIAKQAEALCFTPEHERAWTALARAFRQVREQLALKQSQDRVLDFAGLEAHALRALEDPGVRTYYRERWIHALVDELQDTNPVQERLLLALFEPDRLTVVGDPKQSIYGFRRADLRVFGRTARAVELSGGARVHLDESFRSHRELVEAVNGVFAGLMGEGFQPLTSRRDPPHAGPHLEAFLIASGPSQRARRRAEALEVARRIRGWVEKGLPVWDRETGEIRPAGYRDFAVLARAWSVLEEAALALLAEGVPAVLTRGGNLLEAREVKDGLALLLFLADPEDDLALVAVLRSPFFAVSDRVLQDLAREDGSWWTRVRGAGGASIRRAAEILSELLHARRREPPSRLLQQADRLTGYTAVLANLPLGERRLADWRAFLALVRELERGNEDVFVVVRRLRELLAAEVRVEQPALAAGDAVSLMTIHAAKGLEWPVVFVTGLDYVPRSGSPPTLFDPMVGVGLKLEDDPTGIYKLLDHEAREASDDELVRLLYVALTRAGDRAIVSAAKATGAWNLIADHLPEIKEIAPETGDFAPPFPEPPRPGPPEGAVLEPTPLVFDGLPISALDTYRFCPLRFHFAYVEGHPGAGERAAWARRVGTVVHDALALGLTGEADLGRLDPGLPPEHVADAVELVRRFHTSHAFARFRAGAKEREKPVTLEIEGLTLSGFADLVGEGWVLDYKTHLEVRPEEHRLQVWAYAKAASVKEAYLAYLRHDRVVQIDLDGLSEEASRTVRSILAGTSNATPSERCHRCPYLDVCEDGQWFVADR